jgi:hypothetical protein
MKKTIVDDNFEITLCVTSKSTDYNAEALLDNITSAVGTCIYDYVNEATAKKLAEFIKSITANKVICSDTPHSVAIYTNNGFFYVRMVSLLRYKLTDPNGKFKFYRKQEFIENLNNLLLKRKIEDETENQSND